MKSKKKSGLHGFIEIVLTVAVAVGLALLIQAFVVKPYRIPSPSMLATLDIGQRVLTNRLISHPSVCDIVVFHTSHGGDNDDDPVCAQPNQCAGHPQACYKGTSTESDQTFIKRVVAGPGDRISIIDGHVIRNGVREKDPYIEPCGAAPSCTFRKPITSPPGEYFMMGDNRGVSDDSRFCGPVPDKWVIGVAFFTYWPPDRIGTL